ncbi:efflux RND transporter periplasmic adaptor subunit [Tardiphaga sp. 285_C5_N1_2]|uniref:efflux RND transporter periplasmic adaptor subunit n=1 Tax=Tardiphaga sp. 285_C5_N1_2 TaxID=3240775 RepID=UPI003F8B8E6F
MTHHPLAAPGRVALVFLAALSLAACDAGAKKVEDAKPNALRVVAAKPTIKAVTEWDEYTGRFTAVESVQIRARVSGYLTAIHFQDGQMVKQGDLLFTIDRRPFAMAAASAEADAKVADSTLGFARQELARAEVLRKSDTVPERTFDERTTTVRQGEARLAAANAALDRAKLNLEFTEVRAPVSGRIDTHTVSVGNLISGGDTNATLLTNIVSLDPIRLTFDVDQDAYLKYVRSMQDGSRPSLREGINTVRIALPGDKGFPRSGKLDFVSNQIDRGSGTVRMRSIVGNKDLSLAPGLFAKVQLAGTAAHDAVMIPDQAVSTDQGARVVFVVEDGKARLRNVTLGPLIDGLRLVRDGVGAGDVVISSGSQNIRAGEAVAVVDGPSGAQRNADAQTGGVIR